MFSFKGLDGAGGAWRFTLPMRMQVVDIRKVGVAMCEPGMAVHMGVRFHPIPRKIVVVLVMGIVPVPVPMGHFFMVMPVGMVFSQMEPNAHTH